MNRPSALGRVPAWLLSCTLVAATGASALGCETSPPGPTSQTPHAMKGTPTPTVASGATEVDANANAALTLLPDAGAEPKLPPYDLGADLVARDADAHARLGKGIETAVVGGVFVFVGARGYTGAPFAQSRDLVTRALAAFDNGRFGKRPAEAITVYLFPDDRSYGAFCKAALGQACISIYGFYWPRDRWMVMNAGLGIGTLTHELVHPLVEADFPDAPTWLNEGMASIFEAPVLPKAGEIHGAKNWRLPRLKAALGSGERAHALPHTLFGMPDDTFRDDREALHYSLARYFCQWLDERGKLWEFYHAFRDGYANDPTGVQSFRKVTGTTPEEAERAFLGWVARL